MPLTAFEKRRPVQDILGETTFFPKKLGYELFVGMKVRSTGGRRCKGKGEWCAIGYAADKAKILERHSISL
jgi:hypothetical protein